MSWDDPPYPPSQNKIPGGQQDQGHEVFHHDQGEGYQQPKSFMSGSGSVPLKMSRGCPTWDQNSIFLLEIDL